MFGKERKTSKSQNFSTSEICAEFWAAVIALLIRSIASDSYLSENDLQIKNFCAKDSPPARMGKAQKKTGKGRPRSVPPCLWSATSLFVTKDSAYEVLPKVRQNYKLLAAVKITQQCGVGILKRQHTSSFVYAWSPQAGREIVETEFGADPVRGRIEIVHAPMPESAR